MAGLRQKREPVKALILNTWVTSQYLDALTPRQRYFAAGGLLPRARDMREGEGGEEDRAGDKYGDI